MTDWSALLPDVARRLLGEPTRTEHGGDTWRYRTHGSLAVHVGGDRRGTFHDFEADVSGGTFGLVQHVLQTDRSGTIRWLVDAGLIAPSNSAPFRAALLRPRASATTTARCCKAARLTEAAHLVT